LVKSRGDGLLRDQVILVVLGFVLTSVAGGLIAHYFQGRTAERNRRESERQAAATVFDEISRAMDRRLYRMWLWHWALKSGDGDRIDKALNEYRTVSRNGMTALTETLPSPTDTSERGVEVGQQGSLRGVRADR
jgi:hypothetical protein